MPNLNDEEPASECEPPSATDRYRLLLELNPSQALAVEVIDRGGSHAEAAEAAGVDRTTVSRWVSRHPAVIAELNRRRLDRARSNARVLAETDRKALACIADALESGDPNLALQWFKIRDLANLTGCVVGPTDATVVIQDRASTLPNDFLKVYDKVEGRTAGRAVDVIWAELEGSVDLGVTELVDWKDELLSLALDELIDLDPGEIEEILENVDLGDPEVVEHLQRLGLAPSEETPGEPESDG